MSTRKIVPGSIWAHPDCPEDPGGDTMVLGVSNKLVYFTQLISYGPLGGESYEWSEWVDKCTIANFIGEGILIYTPK